MTPGNHTITFKVKDDDGLWSTNATTSVEINARPIVSLEAVIPTTIYLFSGSTDVQDADDNTLAFWNLDDNSGSTASDSSSNDKDGTLKNNPLWTDGLYNKAISFDGSNDYVQVPELIPGDVFDVVTIEAWVKLEEDVSDDDEWVIFGSGKDGILKFGINDDEKPFVFTDSESFGSKTVTSNEILVSGYWYHLAAVYDSDSNLIQIYVNHQMVANSSIPVSYTHLRAHETREDRGWRGGG